MTNVWYPSVDVALKRVGKKHRRANWLEPLLAKSLAVSFWAPEWCVNYFRLVRMHAFEDRPVLRRRVRSGVDVSTPSRG